MGPLPVRVIQDALIQLLPSVVPQVLDSATTVVANEQWRRGVDRAATLQSVKHKAATDLASHAVDGAYSERRLVFAALGESLKAATAHRDVEAVRELTRATMEFQQTHASWQTQEILDLLHVSDDLLAEAPYWRADSGAGES